MDQVWNFVKESSDALMNYLGFFFFVKRTRTHKRTLYMEAI